MTGTVRNTVKRKVAYFERVNSVTGERSGRIDVTDRSERDREKIEMGALRNLHPDWYLDFVEEPAR